MSGVTSPGKIILLGEHSVVYGQPAIALPVSGLRASATIKPTSAGSGLRIVAEDLGRVFNVEMNPESANDALTAPARLLLTQFNLPTPDLDIVVHSEIPVASGLGSGAAISSVVIRALASAVGVNLSLNDLNNLVYSVEQMHHGTPSGVDNTVIVYERPVYFTRGQPIEFLDSCGEYLFLIGDTDVAAPTRIAVEDVARLYQAHPERFGTVFQKIGALVSQARHSLQTADYAQLGSLMVQNHLYLQRLTISSPELDKLVNAALNAGALGAKLSGGGRGGNMIALVNARSCERVRAALCKAGAVRVYETILR
jgi:mevalonate kinase